MTDQNDRSEYIAGLRALADLLEEHPDVGLPTAGTASQRLHWVVTSWESDPKAATTSVVRAVGGKWTKRPGGTDGEIMVLHNAIRGLFLEILVRREAVCERVVKGTEKVKVAAVKAQPARTETREIVEWVCAPLLAGASS